MIVSDFVNRRTSFRFAGKEVLLDLSLGLFSSAGVDAGSMLLLKSLGKELDLDGEEAPKRVLDVGCGAGTLGLAMASRLAGGRAVLVDRDELAVAFSRHNAAVNSLKNVETTSRLMIEGPHEAPYGLIVSNFPAKAGDPVLADFLKRSLGILSPGGRAAVVIVHTLADRCRHLINAVGGEIVHEDATKMHSVFHYRNTGASAGSPMRSGTEGNSGAKSEEDDPLAPYIRHSGEFKIGRTRYRADTVWNVPDFDTLSWRLALIGDTLDREPRSGTMVFSEPGQGHLPVAVAARKGARPERIVLAGRDRLQLLISRHNLERTVPGVPAEFLSLTEPSGLADALGSDAADFLVTDLNPVPRTDWTGPLRAAAAAVVKSGGEWAVVGRSADVTALLKSSRGWTPLQDGRNRGWRATVLRRN